MQGHDAGENRAVVHGNVPCQLRTIGDADVIADMAIVRQVHIAHDEAARADPCHTGRRSAAVHGRILADRGVGPDLDPGFFASELEVLRVTAENGAGTDRHAGGQPHIPFEGNARTDPTAVADRDVGTDDRKRTYLDASSDHRIGIHDRGGMDRRLGRRRRH